MAVYCILHVKGFMKLRNRKKLTRPTIKLVIDRSNPGVGNVFLDLGFPPEEAEDLRNEAIKMIEKTMRRKSKNAELRQKSTTKKIRLQYLI